MADVEVHGDKALARALSRAARDVENLTPPTRAAAREVERRAARLAPRRTGRLAGGTRSRVTGGTAVIANAVRYAPYQEYGTRVMPAHPFMRPALYTAPIEQEYEAHVRQAVRRL